MPPLFVVRLLEEQDPPAPGKRQPADLLQDGSVQHTRHPVGHAGFTPAEESRGSSSRSIREVDAVCGCRMSRIDLEVAYVVPYVSY